MARKPGPKHPEKYPVATGESYDYYGEQPGFDYDPYTDEYVPDKETVDQFYEQSGIDRPDKKEDEVDLVSDVLLPIAGSALAYEGVKQGLPHLFSLGSEAAAPVAAQVAEQATAQVAGQAANAGANAGTYGAQVASDYNTISGLYDGAANLGGQQVAQAGTPWFEVGAPSYAGYLGALGSAANVGMNWDDWGDRGDDYRNTRIEQQVAEGVANVFTGGLAGLANQGIRAIAPDFMDKIDQFAAEYGPVGILSREFGTGKDKDQLDRDVTRNWWQHNKWTDDNDMMTLADGSQFNIGLDGGARLQNTGSNIDGKSDRGYYDVDFSNKSATDLIPIADILSMIDRGGGSEKQISDTSGMLINAATSSGDPGKNIAKMLADRGLDHGTAYAAIHKMQEEQLISKERGDAAKNALDEFYQRGAYAPGGSHYGVKSQPPAPFSMGAQPPQVTPPQIGGRPAPFSSPAPGVVPPKQPAQQMQQAAPFSLGRGQKERISPGVWRDEKGTYNSKTGVRGQ